MRRCNVRVVTRSNTDASSTSSSEARSATKIASAESSLRVGIPTIWRYGRQLSTPPPKFVRLPLGVADFLRVFEAKALASALTDAGYSVSERTVQRWKAGRTKPKPQDVQAVRELVGALTAEYESAPPPKWAEGLATRVAEDVVSRLSMLLGGPDSPMAQVAEFAASLRESGLLPDEGPPEESATPQGGSSAGRQPVRSRRAKA